MALAGLLAFLPAVLHSQAAAELQLTPDRLTLEAGKRQAIYAVAYDRQGNIVTSAAISFLSSDTTVATVSRDGTVTAVANGTARIDAVMGELRASSAVTVSGGTPRISVASMRVEPRAVWLLPLEPARLVARPLLADGSVAQGARIRWRTLAPRIATVDRDGLVVGAGPGQTLVEASIAGGPADTVLVAVDTARFATIERISLAPGSTDTLVASVPSQSGRRLAAGLTWVSSDTAVVRVGIGGEVTALSAGESVITVSGYGMTGRIGVFVHRPVHSLTITPRASAGPVRLAPGTSRRFEVRAVAADSSLVPDAAIAWELQDPSVATFLADSGVLAALRTGTTTLSARLDGFETIAWAIEVVPARVALDRARLGLPVGARATLRGSLVDESGAEIGGVDPALDWTSSSATVAAVAGGEIEARSPGRATVTATSPWGERASAEVFVTGDLLVSSNRGGIAPQSLGIHQLIAGRDELHPILRDSATSIEAVFSPDRSRIAFSSNRAGSFDLYIMDADGANVTRITSEPGSEGAPAWTPDGGRLVFALDRDGGPQIASIALDGTGLSLLTTGGGGNRSPSVSPDGRSIAFSSARDGNAEIYTMDIDGGNLRRITTDRGRDHLPRWLPDGTLLYVASRQRGGAAIVRLGGGSATPIVESADPIVALAVSPDGARFGYVAGRALDRSGSRVEYRLVVQGVTAIAPTTTLRFAPGEQVATPSF